MMTSWFREYTFNQNFKRGGRETGDRSQEREREREEKERERERERERGERR